MNELSRVLTHAINNSGGINPSIDSDAKKREYILIAE
jgi:hypothetical protein